MTNAKVDRADQKQPDPVSRTTEGHHQERTIRGHRYRPERPRWKNLMTDFQRDAIQNGQTSRDPIREISLTDVRGHTHGTSGARSSELDTTSLSRGITDDHMDRTPTAV